MVWPEDGGVPREIVKVVHYDRHKQVYHDEAAEEDKAHKVKISGVAAAALFWVEQFAGCSVSVVWLLITRSPSLTGQHDVRPGLACGAPEKNES